MPLIATSGFSFHSFICWLGVFLFCLFTFTSKARMTKKSQTKRGLDPNENLLMSLLCSSRAICHKCDSHC